VILQVPAEIPDTVPDDEPTVAIDTLLLIHEPPLNVLDNVDVALSHALRVPVIAAGLTFTVIVSAREHPVGSVYVTIVVPVLTPLRIPLDDPIVATPEALLVHDPPVGVDEIVVVAPVHAEEVSENVEGFALTVKIAVE
jgi:hypothetical protein